MSIKRSVSFYSYQEAYYKGESTLEDLIRFTGETLKAEGVEILAEQTPVGRFPDPTDEDVDRWKAGWRSTIQKPYASIPSLTGIYNKQDAYPQGTGPADGADIRLAKGSASVIGSCAPSARRSLRQYPIAEYHGVKMGLEVLPP